MNIDDKPIIWIDDVRDGETPLEAVMRQIDAFLSLEPRRGSGDTWPPKTQQPDAPCK